MTAVHLSPVHAMPSGLCEDTSGDATALIAKMAQGDRSAQEELFQLWGPVFLGISQRMLGDPKVAAKVLRDTFVRMWQRSANYDPHLAPPFVWAFTILRELCIARLRQRGRDPMSPLRMSAVPPTHEDPQLMVLDDWRRLRAAMDSLPSEERACLETAVFLGYARSRHQSPSETASATVKACLRRALDIIRNQLSRYEL